MAPSNAGFTYKKMVGHEKDSDVSWCKYVCGFLKLGITNQDYSSWRNSMMRKMEQERITSWRQSTDAQWAAIQAHSLTLTPVATPGGGSAVLSQSDTVRGRGFTESLDFGQKDVAKTRRNTLESLTRAQGAPILAPPILARNDFKLSQLVSQIVTKQGRFHMTHPHES